MHPVLTIGLAYAAQEIEAVPAEAHDRVLDLVVTEAEVIRSSHPGSSSSFEARYARTSNEEEPG